MELTETEYKVAEQIARGFAEKEIAEKMCISPTTVHNHAYRIRKKWNARSAVDVCRMFILRLDNPKQFFAAILFLILQFNIILYCPTMDLRRSSRNGNRITRTSRRKI